VQLRVESCGVTAVMFEGSTGIFQRVHSYGLESKAVTAVMFEMIDENARRMSDGGFGVCEMAINVAALSGW